MSVLAKIVVNDYLEQFTVLIIHWKYGYLTSYLNRFLRHIFVAMQHTMSVIMMRKTANCYGNICNYCVF